MSILTVELPDETMESLQRAARARGQEVETLVREWAQTIDRTPEPSLLSWAGIFDSQTPDLAHHHDRYLAEEMTNSHADAP